MQFVIATIRLHAMAAGTNKTCFAYSSSVSLVADGVLVVFNSALTRIPGEHCRQNLQKD
jgi:hypothetical protein